MRLFSASCHPYLKDNRTRASCACSRCTVMKTVWFVLVSGHMLVRISQGVGSVSRFHFPRRWYCFPFSFSKALLVFPVFIFLPISWLVGCLGLNGPLR